MKKTTLLLLSIFYCYLVFSQEGNDSSISVNLLSVPAAPAFTILGISPTSIEEPTTPTDLVVSIKNNTKNYTALPSSYALSFAPMWVFGGDKISYEKFKSNNFYNNLKQSALVSFGTNLKEIDDTTTATQLGLGVRFSLFRGKIDENYQNLKGKCDSIYQSLSQVAIVIIKMDSVVTQDSKWKEINDKYQNLLSSPSAGSNAALIETLAKLRDVRENVIRDSLGTQYPKELKTEITALKNLGSRIKFERTGFKCDIGLGLGTEFENQKWENMRVFNYGVWINTGNTWVLGKQKKDDEHHLITALGSARLLMFNKESYQFKTNNNADTTKTADNLRFDIGARFIYKSPTRFSASGEAMYRMVLNNPDIKDTYRLVMNLDYQVAKNQTLTLSLGRDFDGTFSKDGNLVAALNLIMGIGNKRPF